MIYIEQYGGWWSATATQWAALVAKGLAGQEYDLDADARRLADRPRTVYGTKQDGLWCSNGQIVHPLDWNDYDWKVAAEQQAITKEQSNVER